MVGLSLVTTWLLTHASIRVCHLHSFDTLLLGRGVEREKESDTLPAFKELGCLSLEHLTLFKEDAPAGGSSGEPKSVVWEERRRFQQFLGTRDASRRLHLEAKFDETVSAFLFGASMSPDFVFTEGSVLTVLVDSATGSHPGRKARSQSLKSRS